MNRGKHGPTIIPEIVDRKIIKGNINLTDFDKKKRYLNIYLQYHKKIKKIIKEDNIKILISLHSFNPIFKKNKRKIHFGVLSNQDRRLSEIIIEEMKLRRLKVGDNEPYVGNLIGDTMYTHGLKNNLHHSLIEVRNDLLSSSIKVNRISTILKIIIEKSINRI